MESPPFEDPIARIENALSHIALVSSRFQAYASNGPHFRVGGSGVDKFINFGSGAPLPKSIATAVGDAIHNLRSALDIMAGDVVQASNQSRKGVLFPFAGDEKGLEEMIKEKRVGRASPDAVELLKSFRPYKGGNATLRALHDLDLIDKHNFVISTAQNNTVSMQIGNMIIRDCTFGGNGRGDIGFGGGVPFSIPKVLPKLLFARHQPLGGMEVIPSLHDLANLTRTIVEAFAALFAGERHPSSAKPDF